MYSLVMAALMLFPWLLTLHIALGSFRVARKELRRGRGAGWRGRLGITGGASLDKPVPPGAGQVHSLVKISSRTDIRSLEFDPPENRITLLGPTSVPSSGTIEMEVTVPHALPHHGKASKGGNVFLFIVPSS